MIDTSSIVYLVMNLRDLHRVGGRALAVDLGERGRAVDRVRHVVDVVGRVEVLAVPAAGQKRKPKKSA
jgi:hypothetical protein